MGTNCPSCRSPVEGEFGLVNCANCGAPVLIGLDGEITSEAPAPIETESMPMPEPTYEEPLEEQTPWTDYKEPAKEASTEFYEEVNEEVSEELHIPDAPPPLSPPSEASNDLREIASFGNEELSEVSDSFELLDLIIQGIDTAEIRQSVIEAIEDKKLNIDMQSAVEGLQSGDMVLKEIAPLKCAIIVQRLKSLPVDLRWEHHEPS